MRLFDRLLRGRLSDLVTCIVQSEGESWTATWASDGRTPPDVTESGLTALTDRAAVEVAGLYENEPQALTAELQFAIYPWPGGDASVILDIKPGPNGFHAADIQGSGLSATGPSLEALVQDAGVLPDPRRVMFRWIRPIREIDAALVSRPASDSHEDSTRERSVES